MIERRQLKTGISWRVRFYQPDGTERSKSFHTKREAEHFERETLASKAQGTYVDPARARITVAQMWAIYIQSRKTELKPKTIASYEFAWNARISPRWAGTKLSMVTWEGVQDWVDDMTATNGADSIHYAHRVFALILGHAVQTRRLSTNPARKISLPPIARKTAVFLNAAQVEQLAVEVALAGKSYGDAVRSLAYLGLRAGELLELRGVDVDLERSRISVHRNVTAIRGKYVVGTPKTKASYREVPIPEILMPVFETRTQNRGPNDLIFSAPSDRNKYMRLENMRRDTGWKDLVTSMGVPGLTIHGLRHSYASLMRRAGVDMLHLSRLMGHSSIAVTAGVYSHLFSDEASVAADMLSKLVRETSGSELYEGSND